MSGVGLTAVFLVGFDGLRRVHENFAVRAAFPMLIVISDRRHRPSGSRESRAKSASCGIFVAIQHLRQDFQPALDVVAHPCALQFRPRIVPAEIIDIGQAPKIHRLDECAAVVMKISLGAVLGQRQRLDIHVEPRRQQVVISRGDQRPVDQTRVLVPIRGAPRAEIRIVIVRSLELTPSGRSCPTVKSEPLNLIGCAPRPAHAVM